MPCKPAGKYEVAICLLYEPSYRIMPWAVLCQPVQPSRPPTLLLIASVINLIQVCKLNIKDFDFKIKELRVKTEKAHTLDTLRVPQFLFEQTLEYIQEQAKEIDEAQGHLFYKDKRKSHTSKPYLDLNYIRKVFRYYISLAGLNEVYDATEESSPSRAKRKLFRLTTHSLRHFSITTFNRAVGGDITLTKAFARHREISSTQVYVHTSKEELYGAIEKAFLPTFIDKKVNFYGH